MDILTREITSKRVRGNDVDFSISEITSKKYVEMTGIFVEIWPLTNWRNTNVEPTWIRRGMPVGDIEDVIKNISTNKVTGGEIPLNVLKQSGFTHVMLRDCINMIVF